MAERSRLDLDMDSIIVWFGKGADRGIGLHVEHPWSACVRMAGPPGRAYLHVYFGVLIVAFGEDGKIQPWSPKRGFVKEWKWVTFRPADFITCNQRYLGVKAWLPGELGTEREWACSRLRGHNGPHA